MIEKEGIEGWMDDRGIRQEKEGKKKVTLDLRFIYIERKDNRRFDGDDFNGELYFC